MERGGKRESIGVKKVFIFLFLLLLLLLVFARFVTKKTPLSSFLFI